MSNTTDFLRDRIQINSILIVLSFVSVLALSSQSAASYATYLLALAMLLTVREWSGALRLPLLWLTGAVLGYLFLSSFWSDGYELVDKVGSTWFLIWLPVGIGLGLSWNRTRANVRTG